MSACNIVGDNPTKDVQDVIRSKIQVVLPHSLNLKHEAFNISISSERPVKAALASLSNKYFKIVERQVLWRYQRLEALAQ